jgi:hypothetical protein
MSSPFQQKFMAKNPTKGFTMDQLEKSSKKAEKQMKSAAILPQIEGPGNPDFESKDPQKFAGDDTHTYGKKDDSPLNAYVSTAGHFQRMQDNIAAAFTPKKETGPTSEDKKNQAEEAYWKSKTTTSEENIGDNSEEGAVDADSADPFNLLPSSFKKRNPYYIGSGVDENKNHFNRFGQ